MRPDGSYDQTFSGDGEDQAEIVAGAPGFESGTSVVVQPSGRILVGVGVTGTNGDLPPNAAFGLMRLLRDGGLDRSFAGDGRQATRFGPGASGLTAVASRGSRIIAAGSAGIGTGNSDFAVAAYDGGVSAAPTPSPRSNRSPDSNIRRLARRPRAGRPIRFRGTASDDGRVARVDLALLRARTPQGRPKRCLWLRNRRSGFAQQGNARRGRCTRLGRFVRADGTTRWRLRLRRGLPAGRYVLYSRATDDRGAREKRFSARDRNRLSFTVRRASAPSPRP